MTTAATALLGLALPVTAELQGTWGDVVNNSLTSLLDTAIAGTTTLSTDGDVTLSTTTLAANQARQAILLCSGARTAIRTITAPAQSKIYTIINATTGGYAVKLVGVGPTTGLTIPNGASAVVAWNGSDFIEIGSSTIGNLTVNGNLTVTGTTTLSGGTANGVAYLNGSKVLTTGSALTFDGTSLSVGTSSHPSTLAVYAATGGSTTGLTVNASGNMLNLFGSSSTNAGVIFDATDGTVGSATGVPMIYRLGGTEGMRLTSTGLGIGTSSPTSKLEIKTAADKITQFLSGSGTAVQWQTINDAKTANVPLAISTLETYFFTNGLERMRLDSSGNLGLGVTPSAWSTGANLEINGNTGNLIFRTSATVGLNWYYNAGYKYIANGYANYYQQYNGTHAWFNAPSGTAGNAISFTQAMTLDASGRLAIGTTTAGENLTINSANAANARIGLQYNSSALTYFGSYSGIVGAGNATDTVLAATGVLAFAAGGTTERARIDSSGNLLVGTTSAGAGAGFATRLAVDAGGNDVSLFKTSSNGSAPLRTWTSTTTGDATFVNFATETSYTSRGSITYNRTGGLIVYGTSSDYRSKDIIGPVTDSGMLIDSVPVYLGKMKGATQARPMFIAHETPEYAHTGEKDAVDADGNPVYQQMDASSLVPVLWAEVQSLRKRLAAAGIA